MSNNIRAYEGLPLNSIKDKTFTVDADIVARLNTEFSVRVPNAMHQNDHEKIAYDYRKRLLIGGPALALFLIGWIVLLTVRKHGNVIYYDPYSLLMGAVGLIAMASMIPAAVKKYYFFRQGAAAFLELNTAKDFNWPVDQLPENAGWEYVNVWEMDNHFVIHLAKQPPGVFKSIQKYVMYIPKNMLSEPDQEQLHELRVKSA